MKNKFWPNILHDDFIKRLMELVPKINDSVSTVGTSILAIKCQNVCCEKVS